MSEYTVEMLHKEEYMKEYCTTQNPVKKRNKKITKPY